ncbi:hypothetical protein K7X08_017188 [Anisodus acutangulus]|uniref:PGG domain-containing protein n=1 Tax=Anisodus acutangulus TaxID=402998 RepID=A0A9Q1LU66_9SOLA|nr:hypothetical protein K7X08_017188 [Anisodus acutangulus]
MKAAQIHVVVATLLMTVTFAAGFTLPGGFDSDTNSPNKGTAILVRKTAFRAFVVSDDIAFTCSAVSIFIYFLMADESRIGPSKLKTLNRIYDVAGMLQFSSMSAVVIAFSTGMYATLVHSLGLAVTVCVIGCLSFFMYLWVFIRTARSFDLSFHIVRAFVVSDAISFACSAGAVFTYFAMAANAISSVRELIIIIRLYRISTVLQLLAMSAVVIAFATGMYVTLAHSVGLAVAVCVTSCISFVMFCYVLLLLPGSRPRERSLITEIVASIG